MPSLADAPRLSLDAAARLARDLFGVVGTPTALPSERDQNVCLTGAGRDTFRPQGRQRRRRPRHARGGERRHAAPRANRPRGTTVGIPESNVRRDDRSRQRSLRPPRDVARWAAARPCRETHRRVARRPRTSCGHVGPRAGGLRPSRASPGLLLGPERCARAHPARVAASVGCRGAESHRSLPRPAPHGRRATPGSTRPERHPRRRQ